MDWTIFVLNHDVAFLELLSDLLKMEGYQVMTRSDTRDAYAWIRNALPSLVILDLQMESYDPSLALLTTIHLDPITAGIPVIVLATDARFFDANAAHFQRHHVDSLAKPFDLLELLDLIRTRLDCTTRRDEPGEANSAASGPEEGDGCGGGVTGSC